MSTSSSIRKTSRLIKRLKQNRIAYERRLRALACFDSWFFSIYLAQRVATLASNRHSGLFSSPELEEYLCRVSKRMNFDNDQGKAPIPNSTLHVMSQAYETGGHTRVVEKWIESSSPSEVHSLLFTRRSQIPARLVHAVATHGGTVYRHSVVSSPTRIATWLRGVATGYSKVVLHIHMDDIIPTIAFSDGTFASQLFFYNHADHRFWVGTSIPSKVLEQRTWGQSLSFVERGIQSSQIIGIPTAPTLPGTEADKRAARLRLGIDPNSKVILTIGNSKKYLSLGEVDYVALIDHLLRGHPERILVAIGPRKIDNAGWASLERRYPAQVRLLPELVPTQVSDYLLAADLGLDSYPLNGGSVTWEMFGRGVPFLTLYGAAGHHDEIIGSQFCQFDPSLWLKKATEILDETSSTFTDEALAINEQILSSYGPEAWKRKISSLNTNTESSEIEVQSRPDTSLLDLYLVSEAGWRERILS